MEQLARWLNAGAARAAFIPIAGLLVGVALGAAWAALRGATDLDAVWIVVKGGLLGSFLGMSGAVAAATGGRSNLTNVRGLAWLIGIAAVFCFFWAAIP
ncbi:hypothetical protein [Planctomyces sp. SH-PL62]|uniref:hypothetical protein n=1 Tax=Planctomyces sp. SH-PL62 TaxID=1636152 RepID=UPI00078B181F|nr:hypothetical protein [Planctomyces sp. SH-PL62]AMV40748.1 hypothetical protein VT85_25170 [Planctomyces sp. SH-PL62]